MTTKYYPLQNLTSSAKMNGSGAAILEVCFEDVDFKTGKRTQKRLYFKGRAWQVRLSPIDAMGLVERLNYGKKKACQFHGEKWIAHRRMDDAIAA